MNKIAFDIPFNELPLLPPDFNFDDVELLNNMVKFDDINYKKKLNWRVL